jgi:MFS family permease
MTTPSADAQTRFADVKISLTLLLCGGVNAVNIAKLSPSIPSLQASFALSLSEIGVLVSVFGVLILLTGVGIAGVVQMIGARRIILLALGIAALGSSISLLGQNVPSLFIGRIIEGLSLITVMLTAPSLIAKYTSRKRRGLIMGIWSGFMPFGNAAVFLFAPMLLDQGAWHDVWLAGLIATLVVFPIAFWGIPKDRVVRSIAFNMSAISRTICMPVLAFLGISFAAHSLVYQSLLQFMPVFNLHIADLSFGWATRLAAIFCMLNLCGNVFSGQMLQKGIAPEKIALCAGIIQVALLVALGMLVSWPIFFIGNLMVIGFVMGWLPAVCFYLVGQYADSAEHIPMCNAWMFQIQAVGMLTGPVMISWVVETTNNWTYGLISLIPFCLLITGLAYGLIRIAKTKRTFAALL